MLSRGWLIVAAVVSVASVLDSTGIVQIGPPRVTPAPALTGYGDGVYRVGVHIAPGAYATDGGPRCAWARRAVPVADPVPLVYVGAPDADRRPFIAAGLGTGRVVVTIEAGDHDFTTRGCGAWQRIGVR
jgi:hypothetical protein